jgi:hypothetical protein
MSRDLLDALRLLFVKARAYQTKRQVLDRLIREEYGEPPFYRKYRVRIVNGVRVLGDKTDD